MTGHRHGCITQWEAAPTRIVAAGARTVTALDGSLAFRRNAFCQAPLPCPDRAPARFACVLQRRVERGKFADYANMARALRDQALKSLDWIEQLRVGGLLFGNPPEPTTPTLIDSYKLLSAELGLGYRAPVSKTSSTNGAKPMAEP